MNIKVFLLTFSIIFVAELFDKTELAVVSLALKEKSKISVFLGVMLAFVIATALAIFLSSLIEKVLTPITYVI